MAPISHPVSSRARSCEASDAFLPPAARAMASRSACLSAGKTASTFLRTFDEIFTRQTSALAPWLTSVPRMAATSTERPAAACSSRR
ncbi:hypothetical protein D3C71_2043080 [compost metagenome]